VNVLNNLIMFQVVDDMLIVLIARDVFIEFNRSFILIEYYVNFLQAYLIK
jgi:hypothetical protein